MIENSMHAKNILYNYKIPVLGGGRRDGSTLLHVVGCILPTSQLDYISSSVSKLDHTNTGRILKNWNAEYWLGAVKAKLWRWS
jgi:hypothetical protein